jgi:hypothetical protein
MPICSKFSAKDAQDESAAIPANGSRSICQIPIHFANPWTEMSCSVRFCMTERAEANNKSGPRWTVTFGNRCDNYRRWHGFVSTRAWFPNVIYSSVRVFELCTSGFVCMITVSDLSMHYDIRAGVTFNWPVRPHGLLNVRILAPEAPSVAGCFRITPAKICLNQGMATFKFYVAHWSSTKARGTKIGSSYLGPINLSSIERSTGVMRNRSL